MGLLLLATGCATSAPSVPDGPRRDLAGRPVLLVASTPPLAAPSATARAGTAAVGAPGTTLSAAPTAAPAHPVPQTARTTRTAAPPYRVVGAVDDARGDQGPDGPAYSDLRHVDIASDGRDARVTVVLGGPLPTRAQARESLGIGVDLYLGPTRSDSDFQLFADGEPDGWFAYLDTPAGFVRYPGSFGLGGDRVVFTVPWTSLGGRTRGNFSTFVDWTEGGRRGVLGGNAASSDQAPDVGSTAYGG